MASLPFKAAVAGSLSLAVAFAAGTAFMTQRVGASFERQAAELQSETPASEAREVGARLAVAAKTAEDLAVAAGALRKNGITNRAVYDTALRDLLAANPSLIGIWTGWEPNALDGCDAEFAGKPSTDASGRFVPYWNRGASEIKREVLTGYDTEADGAYYTATRKECGFCCFQAWVCVIRFADVGTDSVI